MKSKTVITTTQHFNADKSFSYDDKVKTVEKVTTSHGRFPFMGLLNMETFVAIFFLLLFAGAFTQYKLFPAYYDFDDHVVNENGYFTYIDTLGLDFVDVDGDGVTGHLDLVSDVADFTSADTFYEDYYGETFNEFLIRRGNVAVLSLTNLIQNGQFLNEENNWSDSTNILTITNSVGYFSGIAGSSFEQTVGMTSGISYYLSVYTYINGAGTFNLRLRSSPTNIIADQSLTSTPMSYSYVFTDNTSPSFIRYVSASGTNLNSIVDNFSLFSSGSYTKTQIDTALAYYGYLAYNTTYNLPDRSDSDFTAEYNLYYDGTYERYLDLYDTTTDKTWMLPDIDDPRFDALGLDD